MGKTVAESDVDRLLHTARAPHPGTTPAHASGVPTDDPAARIDRYRASYDAVLTERVDTRSVTVWDIPVFILCACLGVFTRIWTDVTLYFDFGEDNGFKTFAIVVSLVLHAFIFAIVANAWRAKWEFRVRNLLAMSALGGYLGFRLLTQM
jgi:hypothetical protein